MVFGLPLERARRDDVPASRTQSVAQRRERWSQALLVMILLGSGASRLQELETAASHAGEELFTRNIRFLRLAVSAWLAHAEQNWDSSVALMRQAAELEASTPKHAVTPGPTLPACELLGDLLLEQAHPAQALVAYRRSLDFYPRRFNGLLGAARAARASDDESLARTFYQELLEVADGGTRESVLEEARTFVFQQR